MKRLLRENILGVGIHAIQMEDAIHQISAWIKERQAAYVCVTPAHSVMDCVNHPELKPLYNESGLTTPDGMAIVWLLKLAGHKEIGRVYGPDLLQTTCKALAAEQVRHFFYGGEPGIAEDLVARLKKEVPDLQVAGMYSPPFRALSNEEESEIIAMFIESGADIIWVGLGSPRQEVWMAEHVAAIPAVLIGVGAAFDFLSGHKKQAPRWIQRSGLEWLFRFCSEPKRLWRRYIQYPKFIWLVILQKTGLRRFPMD
jgi:N-acetylglucosaminyldiphosphoundecaprenol N-acetyl-beta-D-mannosaminyltransferase